MLGGQKQELVKVERRLETDRAEVSEVGEPDLVEVLVADHAVVYEEELDASLDGD